MGVNVDVLVFAPRLVRSPLTPSLSSLRGEGEGVRGQTGSGSCGGKKNAAGEYGHTMISISTLSSNAGGQGRPHRACSGGAQASAREARRWHLQTMASSSVILGSSKMRARAGGAVWPVNAGASGANSRTDSSTAFGFLPLTGRSLMLRPRVFVVATALLLGLGGVA